MSAEDPPTIKVQLTAELQDAIRHRDRMRSDAIRQIQTEVSRAKSEPGFSGEVDDALHVKIIGSYVKKMTKARDEYRDLGERGVEQADKLAFEVEYLGRWLPQSLGAEETAALVDQAIGDLGVDDLKMAGRVVGHIMKSGVEGLDGGLVNRLVRERLSDG